MGERRFLGKFAICASNGGGRTLCLGLFFLSLAFVMLTILCCTCSVISATVSGIVIIGAKKRVLPIRSSRRRALCQRLLGARYCSIDCCMGDFSIGGVHSGRTHTTFLIGRASLGSVFNGCRCSGSCSSTVGGKIICQYCFSGLRRLRIVKGNDRCRIIFDSALDVASGRSILHFGILSAKGTVEMGPHCPRGPANFCFADCARRCCPVGRRWPRSR